MRETRTFICPDNAGKYQIYADIQNYKLTLIADIFKCLELICGDSIKSSTNWYGRSFDQLYDLSNTQLKGRLEACNQIVKDIYQIK